MERFLWERGVNLPPMFMRSTNIQHQAYICPTAGHRDPYTKFRIRYVNVTFRVLCLPLWQYRRDVMFVYDNVNFVSVVIIGPSFSTN